MMADHRTGKWPGEQKGRLKLRVHQVTGRQRGDVLEGGHARLQVRGVLRRDRPTQPRDRLRFAVDRQHAPAAPQQLARVRARAATQIDGEAVLERAGVEQRNALSSVSRGGRAATAV